MTEIWTPNGDPTRVALEADVSINTDPTTARMRGVTIHGNKSFDVPFLSQVTDDLWMGGCTDGLCIGDPVAHLISLYPWEQYTILTELRSFLSVRMLDSGSQEFDQVDQIAAWVNSCRSDGLTVVHCQAGLNRSALVVARALMLEGMSAAEAIALLRAKRSDAVLCNTHFEDWLLA